MNIITEEQHAAMMRYNPEIQSYHVLASQVLSIAQELKTVADEEERKLRESVVKLLLESLCDVWLKLDSISAINVVSEALMKDEDFKNAVEAAQKFEPILNTSLPLTERIALLYEFHEAKTLVTLNYGAKAMLVKTEDGYDYSGQPVGLFLADFAFEFDTLLRIAVRHYRTIKLLGDDKKTHLQHLKHRQLHHTYSMIYELCGPVVQIMNIAPELAEVLQKHGIAKPEYLRTFVLDYLKDQSPHKAMANLYLAKGFARIDRKEIASS